MVEPSFFGRTSLIYRVGVGDYIIKQLHIFNRSLSEHVPMWNSGEVISMGISDLPVKLKQMRRRSGLSQEALAPRLHMSRSNVSKLENGELEIRGKDLLNWAQQTNSQDMLIAIICNVDIATATDMFVQLTQLVGTFFVGGWFM